jgi:hypothetical protein
MAILNWMEIGTIQAVIQGHSLSKNSSNYCGNVELTMVVAVTKEFTMYDPTAEYILVRMVLFRNGLPT